jgi:hypothetical protein
MVKIRNGFVSNSSSSSFVVRGNLADIFRENIFEIVREMSKTDEELMVKYCKILLKGILSDNDINDLKQYPEICEVIDELL